MGAQPVDNPGRERDGGLKMLVALEGRAGIAGTGKQAEVDGRQGRLQGRGGVLKPAAGQAQTEVAQQVGWAATGGTGLSIAKVSTIWGVVAGSSGSRRSKKARLSRKQAAGAWALR